MELRLKASKHSNKKMLTHIILTANIFLQTNNSNIVAQPFGMSEQDG
jgi:hypothetical protein